MQGGLDETMLLVNISFPTHTNMFNKVKDNKKH